MKKYALNLRRILFCSFVFFLFLMLPEWIFCATNEGHSFCAQPSEIGLFFLLAMLLSMIESKKFLLRFLVLLSVLQILEFSFRAYFSVPLTPFAMDWLFVETQEFFSEIRQGWTIFLLILFVIGLPYALLALLISKDVLNRVTFRFSSVLLCGCLALFLYQASLFSKKELEMTQFEPSCFASLNAVESFLGYFGNVLPKKFLKTKDVKEEVLEIAVQEDSETLESASEVYGEDDANNANTDSASGEDDANNPNTDGADGEDNPDSTDDEDVMESEIS